MTRKSTSARIRLKHRHYLKDLLRSHGLAPRLLLILAIGFLYGFWYFSLASRSTDWISFSFPDLKEGDISPQRVIAPFDFTIPKSDRELDIERRMAMQQVLPVFDHDEAAFDSAASRFDRLLTMLTVQDAKDNSSDRRADTLSVVAPSLSRTAADSLVRYLERNRTSVGQPVRKAARESFTQAAGLLVVPDDAYLASYADSAFVLVSGDTVRVEMTITAAEAADLMAITFRNAMGKTLSAQSVRSLNTIMRRFVPPNITYNNQFTTQRRQQARDAVPIYKETFKRNERIIDANEPVTSDQIEILNTVKRELARRSFLENRLRHYAMAAGKTAAGYGLIIIISLFLALSRRRMFLSFSRLLLITVIALIPLFIGYYAAWSGVVSPLLVPVAITSILATILFDIEVGLLVTLGVSLTVASFNPAISFRLGLIYFLAGSAGAFTVGHVRHRKEFYRSMIAVPLTMALAIAATNDWISNVVLTDVGHEMFLGALNGFFCPIIAIGLLPLLESLFNVTTDITLLELSDLNNPLLRELAVKAPGTFASVVVVGMLAEAAAEKVGANPLLCRVGAYYHDIGKTVNPDYFIENQQGGPNPHDRLSPHMSAPILAAHVKEGYELGVKHGLPEAVLDIIRQHHGTSLMQSFYHKAAQDAGGTVDDSGFRYPGPKPQTREAAIVMLADLSEAASRTVQEKSAGRLKTLISTIIQQRFVDGELDESNLTLKDLHNIQESFLPILVSSHHGRIQYPWQQEGERDGRKADKTAPAEQSGKERP